MVIGLLAIGFATLLPEEGNPTPSFCLICGTVGGVDAILNVLLFTPLGAGLALCGVRGRRALMTAFALSLSIETAQLFAIPGRDASLGDLLTNTLGAVVGFAAVRYWRRLLLPSSRQAMFLACAWGITWLLIQAGTGYGLAVELPRSDYYGQLGRRLDVFAEFHGKVLAARVGSLEIPDWRLTNSAQVRDALLQHADIASRIVVYEPAQDVAPIVRIADQRKREIFLVAQYERSLIFGIRTGAATLRVRPPLFALSNAFPGVVDSSSSDTVNVVAQISGTHGLLSTGQQSKNATRAFAIGPELGWTLLAPSQVFIMGRPRETVASLLWMALLVTPLGYMLARVNAGSRNSGRLLAGSAAAGVVLVIGMVLTPASFGIAVASVTDWVAVASGLMLGWVGSSIPATA